MSEVDVTKKVNFMNKIFKNSFEKKDFNLICAFKKIQYKRRNKRKDLIEELLNIPFENVYKKKKKKIMPFFISEDIFLI